MFKKLREFIFKKFKKNKINKYDELLNNQKESLKKKLIIFDKTESIDNEFYTVLERYLIQSDISFELTTRIIELFVKKIKKFKVDKINKSKHLFIDSIIEASDTDKLKRIHKRPEFSKFNIILLMGINGSGKTTTISKLASYYKSKKKGNKVLVVPGDSYRAGAKKQLHILCETHDLDFFNYDEKKHKDPSTIIYMGIDYAKKNKYNFVICDTSGRFQTNINLMKELKKISSVVDKFTNNTTTFHKWLVLDGNNGQNIISQIDLYDKYCQINGIIVTKMDSSSKSGFIMSIVQKYHIPILFLTFGEKIHQIEAFYYYLFLYKLFE